MKDVFEQLAFVKPMVDIGNPRVQEAGVWGMVCTLASLFTGAFRFLSEEVMGVSILFTIIKNLGIHKIGTLHIGDFFIIRWIATNDSRYEATKNYFFHDVSF